MQTLQQQQAPLTEQIQALRNQRDEATQQLGALRGSQPQDLLRLRNEVGLLRQQTNALTQQLSEIRRGLEADYLQSNPTIKPIPCVRFGSYIDAVGNAVSSKADQATFEFENPSASLHSKEAQVLVECHCEQFCAQLVNNFMLFPLGVFHY